MILRIYIALVLSVLYGHSLAQELSANGKFRVVNKTKGCEGLSVQIELIPTAPDPLACTCEVRFGDGSARTFLASDVVSYTYQQPGTYTLTVFGAGSQSDNIQIQVFPDTIPSFEVYACNNGEQISINVTDDNYDHYVVSYSDGSPNDTVFNNGPKQFVDTLSGLTTITVTGQYFKGVDNCTPAAKTINFPINITTSPSINMLRMLENNEIELDMTMQQHVLHRLEVSVNGGAFSVLQTLLNHSGPLLVSHPNIRPDRNIYCFRLVAFNPCSNAAFQTSSAVCTSQLTVTAKDGANELNWTNSGGSVSIIKNGQTFSPVTVGFTVDGNVVCNTEYCYQLLVTYSGGAQSYSLVRCVTAFSTETPTAIENVTAIAGSETGVTLNWREDPNFPVERYNILRSGSFFSNDSLPPFADPGYATEGGHCYSISYKDECGNDSPPGIEVCPIRLTGDLGDNNVITLNWTEYAGWRNGVDNYVVEKYDGNGNFMQIFQAGTELTLTDNANDPLNQVYIYIVRANANEFGLGQAVSNAVMIIKDPNIYYPAAFTPNGDNLNDLFRVFGQYIINFEMRIFNRWGELMFTTRDMEEGWDGTFNGREMPEGTYVFVAEISDLAGRVHERSGSVHLLRKR